MQLCIMPESGGLSWEAQEVFQKIKSFGRVPGSGVPLIQLNMRTASARKMMMVKMSNTSHILSASRAARWPIPNRRKELVFPVLCKHAWHYPKDPSGTASQVSPSPNAVSPDRRGAP